MNVAFLNEESPFHDLFPRGVPIVNVIVPSQVELEGSSEKEAYMVDVQKLTPEQFHGIADRVAAMFGEEVWVIRREMLLRGLPIRASQVRSVATDLAWFL